MIVIHHTEPRTHTFQLAQKQLVKNGKPSFTTHPKSGEKIPVMVDQPSITILPGMNVLSDEEYEAIASSEGYRARIDEGMFEEVFDGETLPNDPETLHFIFSNTVSLNLLREWREEYEDALSKELVELLDEQIMKITRPKEYAAMLDEKRAFGGKNRPRKRLEKKKLSAVKKTKRKVVKKSKTGRADFDTDNLED